MAAKTNSRKWMDVQLVIATVSMTAVLGFWNMFAGPDKEKAAQKAALDQTTQTPTPTEIPQPTAGPTMPPAGYTILYGGQAPQPQIIVQRQKGGGGGGGDGGGGGGGGGGAAPVTSSGSS